MKCKHQTNNRTFSERELINISLMKNHQFCAVQGISSANRQDNMCLYGADAPVACEDRTRCSHCSSR